MFSPKFGLGALSSDFAALVHQQNRSVIWHFQSVFFLLLSLAYGSSSAIEVTNVIQHPVSPTSGRPLPLLTIISIRLRATPRRTAKPPQPLGRRATKLRASPSLPERVGLT